MAFAGSKLNGLFVRTWSIPQLLARGVAWVARRIEQWRTWQGATPDQRRQMRCENRRRKNSFDWMRGQR